MKNPLLYALILISISFYFLFSCTKNATEKKTVLPQNKFTIENAKTWYESNNHQTSINLNTRSNVVVKKLGSFKPNWSLAHASEDEKYYVVECQINFDKKTSFILTTSVQQKTDTANSRTDLLVIKDKKTNEIQNALIHIAAETGSNNKEMAYNKKNTHFSGYVFFTTFDGEYINGWHYADGKVIERGTTKTNSIKTEGKLRTPIEGECTTTEIGWFLETCDYESDGTLLGCNEEYLYSTFNTYCTVVGGGGGDINPPSWGNSLGSLCENYRFTVVGNSFTGTINNLRWNFRSPQGVEYTILYSESCLSIPNYNITSPTASSIFNTAFNDATNQVLAELNSNILLPSGINLRLKALTQSNLQSLKPGSSWSSAGACAGYIGVTNLNSYSYCP